MTVRKALFGQSGGGGEESNAEYDCEGNKIAQSGFNHELL